jgi:hypothetical protein
VVLTGRARWWVTAQQVVGKQGTETARWRRGREQGTVRATSLVTSNHSQSVLQSAMATAVVRARWWVTAQQVVGKQGTEKAR